jgi:sugar lactone lactonase YvrE
MKNFSLRQAYLSFCDFAAVLTNKQESLFQSFTTQSGNPLVCRSVSIPAADRQPEPAFPGLGQVDQMLFSKHIVSTRTLFQLTVALVFFMVAAVGTAVAANSGNPPLLVPYTMTVVAGNPEYNSASSPGITSGYGGDIGFMGAAGYAVPWVYSGTMGTPNTGTIAAPHAGTSTALVTRGATLNNVIGFAIDAVGNIYIVDRGNDLIREVNYATGLINIVAGTQPINCSPVSSANVGANAYSCSAQSGCSDGVPAVGAKLGSGLQDVAVDAFGNVYFTDSTTETVSVVYRGGTRVADFIKRVNPAAVAASPGGQVTVGYLYHIAGEINLSTCAGQHYNPFTNEIVDNAPAFEDLNNQAGTSGTFPPLPGATTPVYGATLYGAGPSGVGATFTISLDSAGNIYIADNDDHTTRVINTQETPQTFFQYTVLPGYMRALLNCSSTFTVDCTVNGTTQTGYVGTGINGAANALIYTPLQSAQVDAYGNIYQLNGKTGDPGTYAAVAYAGGTPLTNLLTVEAPYLSSIYSSTETAYPVPSGDLKTPNELPLTYGNAYIVGGQPVNEVLPGAFLNVPAYTSEELFIRPNSLNADSFGTMWYYDDHFVEVFRIDQYTATATGITWGDASAGSSQRGTTSVAGLSSSDKIGNAIVTSNGTIIPGTVSNYNTNSPASFTNTWNCVYGAVGAPWLYGPQTFDPEGDGCPASVARLNGGSYYTSNDGLGNLYVGDSADEIIHEITLGNQFPATPVGTSTPVTQAIQVHFDATNIPVTGGMGTTVSIADGPSLGFTTTSFSIATNSGDFSLDTTTQEFPLGSLLVPITGLPLGWGESTLTPNFSMYPTQTMLQNGQPALPTCTQLGTSDSDGTWDCLVYVKFTPTGVGLRTGQLIATTANGSVYYFQLTGVGTGPQLAIDGGSQTTVAATGLGNPSSVAVTSAGTVYIADPTKNQIEIAATPVSFTGATTSSSTTVTVSSTTGLAVGDVVVAPLHYIATNTTIASIGTGTITLSVAATNSGTGITFSALPPPTVAIGSSSAPLTGITPATLNNPQGVAVDAANNIYIADTGNARVLKVNPVPSVSGSTSTYSATVLGNYLWIPGSNCDGGTVTATTNCVFQGYATQAPTTVPYSPQASPAITNPNPIVSNLGPSASSVAVSILNEPGAYVGLTAVGSGSIVPTNPATYTIPGTTGTTAPPQYQFGKPTGVAVDQWGNVYVSDAGNASATPAIPPAVVMIPSNTNLGGATPLMQYPGAPTFLSPVAIAVGAGPGPGTIPATGYPSTNAIVDGYIYVADQISNVVYRIPPGGGDLQPYPVSGPTSGLSVVTSLPLVGGYNFTTPNGLAVDAAGNVYVSDSGSNTVTEVPANNAYPLFALSFSGLNTPGGLALDANGNVYVADSGNGQVQFMNRQNPTVQCGVACTGVLAVSNAGNQPATLTSPFLSQPTNAQFTISSNCTSPMPVGTTCTITPLFTPTSSGSATTTVTVNGTQSISLSGTGIALPPTATPTFSIPPGVYASAQTVYLSDATTDAAIYYTTDGVTTPTISSTLYTSAGITVSATETIQAIAVASGYSNSAVALATYTVVAGTFSYTAPTEPVGTASSTQTATILLTNSFTLGSINVLTQGASGLDFNLISGGTCAVGSSYTAGQTCTVNYTFTPTAPGTRLGAIVVFDNTAPTPVVQSTTYLSGTGTGPMAVFAIATSGNYAPSAQTTLGSGFNVPTGVAVDGSGNVFVADYGNSKVKEIVAAGGYTTVKTLGSGFNFPTGVAVDGSGNVFVADYGDSKVKEIVAAGGYTTVNTLGSGFSMPEGVAVDGSGNVFVGDTVDSEVKEIVAAGGYTTVKTLGSGFGSPAGVTVDGSGNVFVADEGNNAVKEIVAVNGSITSSPTIKTLGSGFSSPAGVTVDGSGNVFVADEGNNAVKEIVAGTGGAAAGTVNASSGQRILLPPWRGGGRERERLSRRLRKQSRGEAGLRRPAEPELCDDIGGFAKLRQSEDGDGVKQRQRGAHVPDSGQWQQPKHRHRIHARRRHHLSAVGPVQLYGGHASGGCKLRLRGGFHSYRAHELRLGDADGHQPEHGRSRLCHAEHRPERHGHVGCSHSSGHRRFAV